MMTSPHCRPACCALRACGTTLALTLLLDASAAAQQPVEVPLDAEHWTLAGDSLRFGSFLGRQSLYLGKGVALARGVELRDGTIEFDMAMVGRTRFLAPVFRARSADAFEMVMFRPVASGTIEAVQYQAGLNGGGTWQLFHGPDANATAELPRDRWVRVRVELAGVTAKVYLGDDPKPVLTVPRLALGYGSGGIGFWAGSFGNGAYFSNLRYTPDPRGYAAPAPADFAPGTVLDWELSGDRDAAAVRPGVLPDAASLRWEPVRAEPWKLHNGKPLGLVIISRYRRSPETGAPSDPDSVMGGRVPRSKVVYARTYVDADRDEYRRLHFGYSDGVVVFANGRPLFSGMNPYPFRDLGGVMETVGEAVYLPLRKGRNEIVLAVTEFFGGWGVWARLDPPSMSVPAGH